MIIINDFIVVTWRVHRKLITPTFNMRVLESFIEVFVRQSNILIRKMEAELDGNEFDVFDYVTRCTLDIICGKKLMFLHALFSWCII